MQKLKFEDFSSLVVLICMYAKASGSCNGIYFMLVNAAN